MVESIPSDSLQFKQAPKLGAEGQICTFLSLKGGVGKTKIVAKVASCLVQLQKRVLCIDGNLTAPSLGLELGYLNPEVTLHDVLKGKSLMTEAVYTTDENIHLIMGSWSRPTTAISSFKYKIAAIKKYYDLILIDTSSVIEEISTVMDCTDHIFCVMTPTYPSLSSALKIIALAKEKKKPVSGIILNGINNQLPVLTSAEIEATTNCKIIATIPYEQIPAKGPKGFAKIFSALNLHNSSAGEYQKIIDAITNNS